MATNPSPLGNRESAIGSDAQQSASGLKTRDLALLTSYSLLLFGIALFSGRPFTLHECVLPQTSRAMFADHDFVVPKIDAKRPGTALSSMPPAPWLESPPLPQWITVGIASLFGRCDSAAIVRLGPTLVATIAVLLMAWVAALWYGRSLGLLAGFVMATTFEFTRYAWSSEDEIFLCSVMAVVMALFVKLEFGMGPNAAPTNEPLRIGSVLFGKRSWWMVAFCIALGATNLCKGLFFGTVMSTVPMVAFLLGSLDPRRIAKYVWVWGGLMFATVMLAWPLAVHARYPDVTDVWYFDLHGRMSGEYVVTNAPIWYYPVNLLWMVAPWTVVIPFGLAATWKRCWNDRISPERFLWCWAFTIPIVFSIPGGKHHHYLLNALFPWAILAALGIRHLRTLLPGWPRVLQRPALSLLTIGLPAVIVLALFAKKIPGPSWLPYALMIIVPALAFLVSWDLVRLNKRWAGAITFAVLLAGYWFGHLYSGLYIDRYRDDAKFLHAVRERADAEGLPVLVDMGTHPFHGMMGLFHLRDNATLLHDLSFLRAAEIQSPEVLLMSLSNEQDHIAQFGEVEQLEQSPSIDRGLPAGAKLTLYRLRFRDDLERVPVRDLRISPMQAMHREPGPFLESGKSVIHAAYEEEEGRAAPIIR